jgi:cobaltochelatase CobS
VTVRKLVTTIVSDQWTQEDNKYETAPYSVVQRFDTFQKKWVKDVYIVHSDENAAKIEKIEFENKNEKPLDKDATSDYTDVSQVEPTANAAAKEANVTQQTVTTQKRGRGRPRKDGTPAQPRNLPTYTPPKPVAQVTDAHSAVMDILIAGINAQVDSKLTNIDQKFDERFSLKAHALENWMNTVVDTVKKYKNLTITTDRGVHVVEGLQHHTFEKLVRALQTTFPVMLVGPAGSGKTTASEQAAEAYGLPYYAISVQSQTSKSDLVGYMTANGIYVRTQFRDAYENGGLFLMDEIDAGNANVLMILNAALAGSQCAFPDGMVKKHKDFKFVATANTYGTGGNRLYVGRNQLDAATLDRFLPVDWDIDETLEALMVESYTYGAKWHKVVKALRASAEQNNYRIVISPRATLKGAQLLEQEFTYEEVLKITILANLTTDQATTLKSAARAYWGF